MKTDITLKVQELHEAIDAMSQAKDLVIGSIADSPELPERKVLKELLKPEYLRERNNADLTGFHLMVLYGLAKEIPSSAFTEEAIRTTVAGSTTLMHYAASYGYLKDLPQEILTVEYLGIIGNRRETPLHCAAENGHLDQLPAKCLTEELLLSKDSSGDTVLSMARFNNHEDQLLGLELSEKCKRNLGATWWAKNEALKQEKARLEQVKATADLDIF